MKWAELFEDGEMRVNPPYIPAVGTNANYRSVQGKMLNRARRPGSKAPVLGNGSYGVVYDQQGKDVSHVLKIGHQGEDEDDAYLAYLRKVLDLHNLYLPQIHELKRFNGPEGTFFKVRLEKLLPLSQMTDEEADALATKWYGERGPSMRAANRPKMSPGIWVSYQITKLSDNPNQRVALQDDALKQALEIIDDLVDQGYANDVGPNNIMFRRTKYGAQPVITDPVFMHSSRSESS